MRLDAYLDEVKVTSQTDPKSLKDRAEIAASALGIKLDQHCFDKPTDQQAPCLAQHTEGLVMDDANASNRVSQLTSGSNGDLMNQLSYSTMGGAGVYSPYIGAIVDTARILASLHTAHFQYIPALALADRRHFEPPPECAAVVPRSEIGSGRSVASRRSGEDAAAASCESIGSILCA